jgi:sugar phosphate isomerase/epimerase
MNCTYALNTSTIRDCEPTSVDEKIKVAAAAGYDGIEPWVSEINEYTASGGTLENLRRQAESSDVKIVNLIGFFQWAVADGTDRKKALAEAEKCFQMAAELNCPYVAAPPTGIHQLTNVNLKDVAERYAELIDVGAPYAVVPVLEFWGAAKTLGTLGEALFVAAESGRDNATVLADVFHMYKGSGHFHGLNMMGPGSISIFHVNDYPAQPVRAEIKDPDRVYPGDGIAPYSEILAYLRKSNFSGVMSLELFNQAYWSQDALTVAKTGLTKLKAVVEAQ